MIYIDYSSAFNTIVPSRLAGRMIELGLNTPLCAWILDFLTARPQVVRVGRHTPRSLTLNTGSPQGCVLSPLLCGQVQLQHYRQFADETVVVSLISSKDEKASLEEVANLSLWCQDNSLMLNVSKTKELLVEFWGKQQHQRTYKPLGINGTAVESSYRYL